MNAIGEWFRRVWYLVNRSRFEAALRQEMESHRAMMREPARFGNTLRLREESLDLWGWRWLDDIVRDLRFAARALRRTPAFTIVAISSLALGLALTASTVSVVNAYLIRSLPYPEVDRLYHVRYAPPGPWEPRGMTALDWTSVEDVVEFPIASAGDTFYATDGAHTPAARGLRVTSGFVDGLGVSVAVGRRLMEQDFLGGSEPVALIGRSLWRDRFGSDPAALGRLLRLEAEGRAGQPETFRIVGVLAPGFYYGRDSSDTVDLLMPLPSPVRVYMARLREGVPPATAERRITEAARQAATSPIPDDWAGVKLESAHERYVGSVRPILTGVAAAVSLVLVIVCANVAVLILLRAMQRQKEVAVRLALGSGRRHIARMLLAETVLLCAAALAVGLALTAVTLSTLAPLIEAQLGRPAPRGTSSMSIDSTVLLMVGGISVLAAVLLSLAPLLTSWGRRLTDALRQHGRTGTDHPSMRRIRSALIAFEVASALVLLVGCGLMVRSVVSLMNTDLGFETEGLVRTRIVLRARNYPEAVAYRRFYEQFAERVSAVAGSSIVFTDWPPFFITPAQLIETESGAAVDAGALGVSAGYFSMLGVDIRQGREFTAADASVGDPAAVISETLARQLWPDGRALGRRVRGVVQTQGGSTPGPWRTVIGVAADVRQTYEDADRNDFYTPWMPEGRYGSFYLRTERPAPLLLESFRAAAADVDPDALVNEPRSVASEDHALAATKFLTSLLSAFATIAVCLAMLGIYGVTAYAVRQRQREIAIRVALGASASTVVRMFMRDGAVLLGLGATAGLLGSAAMSRILLNQMYGVQPFDPLTHLLACGLLLSAGLAAVWWPVRRAATSNPAGALHAN